MVTEWHHHRVSEHARLLWFLHCHGESPEAADKFVSKKSLKRQWLVSPSTGRGWIPAGQEDERGTVRDRGWNEVSGLVMGECMPGL